MRDEEDMVFSSAQIAHILESTNSPEWAEKEWVPLLEEAGDADLAEEAEEDVDELGVDETYEEQEMDDEEDVEEEPPKTLVVTTKEGVPEDVDVVDEEVPPPPDKEPEKPAKKPGKEKKAKKKRRTFKQAIGMAPETPPEPEEASDEPKDVFCNAKDCGNLLGEGMRGMCPGCRKKHGITT